ncbi:MAG: hypothetical protein ACRC5H_04225 [Treponemataceae bacterium]
MITYFRSRKGNFRICEDSLTSTVFDLLKYLPTEILWSILKKSLCHQKLPEISGELIKISFWEKWNSEGTDNTQYVEPDLFLRFMHFDLIIEAKRYNERQQSESQIKKEIQSYYNEYEADNKPLYFIQLGGLHDTENDEDFPFNDKSVVICKTNWTRLLDQIVEEKNKIDGIFYSQTNSYRRILEDLINGLEIHGFFKKLWLETLTSPKIEEYDVGGLFEYAKQYKKNPC